MTIIEGEGSGAADTRRITEWIKDQTARCRDRGAPRRAAPLPVPVLHRVSGARDAPSAAVAAHRSRGSRRPGPGRKLAPAARSCRCRCSRGWGRAVRQELAELGIDTVLDLVTHYPRRYIDGTRLVPIADLAVGDKASVLGEVTRVSRPPSGYGRGRRRAPSRVVVGIADDSGRLDVVFFNQAWRAKQLAVGTLAMFYGTVGLLPGRPPADQSHRRGPPGRRGRRRPGARLERTGAGLPGVPADRQGQAHLGPAGPLRGRGARPGRRPSPTRCPTGGGTGSTWSTAPRPSTTSTGRPGCPSCEPARRRLAFDELFRLQMALVLRQDRLQRDARGIRHVVVRDDATPTLVDRFVEGLPFTPTAAQRRAMDGHPQRPGRPAPHAPPPPGRRRLGQDGGGGGGHAGGGGRRPPGRADGADRGAGRAARHRGGQRSSRACRWPTRRRSRAGARCGWPS